MKKIFTLSIVPALLLYYVRRKIIDIRLIFSVALFAVAESGQKSFCILFFQKKVFVVAKSEKKVEKRGRFSEKDEKKRKKTDFFLKNICKKWKIG